ncbi:hypothetical protein ACWD4G_01430 [Streptomyces sp. NPDC002643]
MTVSGRASSGSGLRGGDVRGGTALPAAGAAERDPGSEGCPAERDEALPAGEPPGREVPSVNGTPPRGADTRGGSAGRGGREDSGASAFEARAAVARRPPSPAGDVDAPGNRTEAGREPP